MTSIRAAQETRKTQTTTFGEDFMKRALACPSENTPYVAELLNWRVQKLILKP